MNKVNTKLWMIINFAILLTIISSLHTKKYTNHYENDENAYAASLYQRQQKIKTNLENLLSDMKKVDLAINDKAPQEQKKQLEQALSSERDALYEIQNYLSEYDMNRPCRCQYMTEEQKKQLNNKLIDVNSSVQAIQKQLKSCDDCNLVQQLNNQLTIEKKYLENLQMTINSKCCKQNTNGTFNGTTVINGTSSINQTYSNCPPQRPFWNQTIKSCTVCSNNGFWNETIGRCQSCPNNNFWDSTIKRCRQVCLKDQIYNAVTQKCQRAPCQPSTPHWNESSKKCQPCPAQTPKFNKQRNICQYPQCQIGRKWDIDLLKCVLVCETGTIYNKTIDQCSIEYSNISTCNIGMTYIEEQLRCVCPIGFQTDSSGQNCVPCSKLQIYDKQSKNCLTEQEYCGYGYFYSQNLTRCFQTCQQGYKFSYTTLTCQFYKTNNETIYSCPEKFIYDPKQHKCISCPQGYVLDLQNIRCLKSA